MNQHLETNRRRWDELVPLHVQSAFYDTAGFEAGGTSLKSIEVEELGDVSGRSLLHLACHFGLDTLSWARRGALVTGVDLSEAAVTQARALAAKCGLEAAFVCSPLETAADALTGSFDIVLMSYGVLCWLADLKQLGRTVAHFLKPGGAFHLIDSHPFADVFNDAASPGAKEEDDLHVVYPYFSDGRAVVCQTRGSYVDRDAPVVNDTSYQWTHTLGEVLEAVIGARLSLDFLHEFPMCFYRKFPGMTCGDDGWWRLPGVKGSLPLMFSLKATRLV